MGNSQSQDSDPEHRSTYNYHEKVLRDARQVCNTTQGYESDDQYVSAEEGDESDRSITPLRTRPESSSGEDFSDDSASGDDERGAEGGQETSHTSGAAIAPSLINESPRFLSPGNRRLLSVKKRSSQVNSNSFLEHDSIGPELDRSRWDASSNNASVRTTRQSSQRSLTGSGSGRRQSGFSASLFIPINTPPYSHNASLRSSTGNSAGTKRKADQSMSEANAEGNDLSKKKKHVLRLSPNKRRLAMLDESDSDSCENDDSRVASRKKSRNSRQFEESFAQAEDNHLKRSIKENSIQTEEPDRAKKGRFSLRNNKINVLGEKRSLEHNRSEKGDADDSPRTKTFKTCEDEIHSAISNIVTEKPVFLRRLQGSAFQPLDEGSNVTVTSQHDNESAHHSTTRTMKMGNYAIRNSLGKVLPVRNSHHNQNTQLSSSGTDVAESSTTLQPIQVSQSETVLPNSSTRGSGVGKHSDLNEEGNASNSSPFQNVVLTPPSFASPSNASNSHSLKRGAENSSRVEVLEDCHTNSRNNGDEDAMETDESQSGMDSMETHPSTPRQVVGAKRSLTTAQRFKNFFTGGSLKSNFKTLFSPNKSGHRSESHSTTISPSNQTSWSLYSSPSSSLFGHSPSSNVVVFQSTSSPINAVHSVSDSSNNLSPNVSSVTGTPLLTTTQPGPRQSITPSSFMVKKREALSLRKSTGVATRTSPRLRRSTTSGGSNTLDSSAGSREGFGSQSSEEIEWLPQTSEFQVLHFRLSQTLELSLAMGDIAEELSDGIVNWTDGALTHSATECSLRICAKAGALMRAGCNSYIENKDGELEAPDVLTTPAGGRFPRSVKALLHVVSPSIASHARLALCLLEVNANCLRFASERLCLGSLSMPLIGEGELPTRLCTEAFIDAVLIYITEKNFTPQTRSLSSSTLSLAVNMLSSIHLVTSDANVTDEAAVTIQSRIDTIISNDLDNVVADIRSRYYGNRDSSLVEGNESVGWTESPDRAKSGRPLVKRPRL